MECVPFFISLNLYLSRRCIFTRILSGVRVPKDQGQDYGLLAVFMIPVFSIVYIPVINIFYKINRVFIFMMLEVAYYCPPEVHLHIYAHV